MKIYIKELKQSAKSLIIWSGAISFMMLVCIIMFPEMQSEMDNVSSLFANMGGFSAAFGMDQLNFGELIGFYGIECGNILGIGGGFFAALVGVAALANEEKEHTAEFLLTHPVSRFSIISQKLLSVLTQVVAMNIVVVAVSLLAAVFIGEEYPHTEFALLHIAYLIMQIEIACICFGISAFIKRGSIGIGLGLSLMLYFLNIVCNINQQAEFLKYITPYAYTEASEIISESKLDPILILIGTAIALISVIIAFLKYNKKDIAS